MRREDVQQPGASKKRSDMRRKKCGIEIELQAMLELLHFTGKAAIPANMYSSTAGSHLPAQYPVVWGAFPLLFG